MTTNTAPLDSLLEFFRLLRVAGLRVGLTETQDALNAVETLEDWTWLQPALKATLIKRHQDEAVFDRMFQLFFQPELIEPSSLTKERRSTDSTQMRGLGVGGQGGGGYSSSASGNAYEQTLQKAAQFMVRHVYNPSIPTSARRVQEALLLLTDMVQRQSETDKPLDEIQSDLERTFLRMIETDEKTPALEALFGEPDVDQIDFHQMDQSEFRLIQSQVERLIRQLLAKPKRRYQPEKSGQLHLRKTVRKSLQYGGVPIKLARRKRRIERPKLFVLTDISSSVEVFSRFFLMLTHAFQHTSHVCRSFVFSDQLHEVTDALQVSINQTANITNAVEQLLKKLRASGWTTRRTDYGTTFKQFHQHVYRNLDRRSTIVILGDARNNQAPAQLRRFEEISQQSKRILWLNPERELLWNTGDSIVNLYTPWCESVTECRNLSQLRSVVDQLSDEFR